MESFFDFITQNLFLVVLIITGLIGYFNKQKSAQNREREERTDSIEQEQPKKQSKLDETLKRVRDMVETLETSLEEPNPKKRTTYQTERTKIENLQEDSREQSERQIPSFMEERQLQYENLKNQYESTLYSDYDFNSPSLLEEKKQSAGNEIDIQVNLDKKLTAKGLIESVIMAEVLGPPRARKPYERFGHKR